jgi:hypothetical protein
LLESIVALGAMTVVPLGLFLASDPDRLGRHPLAYRAAARCLPFAIPAAVATHLLRPGWGAAALAAVWLLWCATAASFGIGRFLRRGVRCPEEIAIDLGLVYLLVGGIWLTAARAGVGLLGFHEPIVLLTASHFHYAGFTAPIIAGTAFRFLTPPGVRMAPVDSIALLCVCTGIPLTAIGISTNHAVEVVAVAILVCGMILMGGILLMRAAPAAWRRRSVRSRAAAILLAMAGLSLAVTMSLALVFVSSGAGHGSHFDGPISIGRMIEAHGLLNAIGFSICGLVGFVLLAPRSRDAPGGIPFSRLAARGAVGADFFERTGVASPESMVTGLVRDLAEYQDVSFRPADVDPRVRSFYEQTAHHRLEVRAEWRRGFVSAGKLWKALAEKLGQLALPTSGAEDRVAVSSRLVGLKAEIDGRSDARGWVRAVQATGRAVYVAAYAIHRDDRSRPYMNIAFPLPGGSLVSILRFAHASSGSIVLRTNSRDETPGDEGIYLVTRWLPIRLPMAESIAVWAAEQAEGPTLRARHELRLFGIRYLILHYEIFDDASRPAVAPQLS